jgi:hypothetical protein
VLRAMRRLGAKAASWFRLIPESVRQNAFPPEIAAELARLAANAEKADTTESLEAEVATKRARLAENRKRIEELLKDLDPMAAVQLQINDLEARISNERARTGTEPATLVLERERLYRQLRDERERLKQRSLSESKPEVEDRVRYENLGRHVLKARIVDENLGIIEVLGDLPCWLANTDVQHTASTYLIPVPVRVTFGSFNERDVDDDAEEPPPPDVQPENVYMVSAAALFGQLDSESLAAAGGVPGHTVPDTIGAKRTEFTFARTQKGSGKLGQGMRPWRITVDQSPPLRELVRLDGSSNRAELEARAKALAQPLLDVPDDVDSGSVVLVDPHNVACNGRISAVSTRLVKDDNAFGFVTEVSFDPDLSPLPDMVGRDPEAGPLRFVFGIDVDNGRDR